MGFFTFHVREESKHAFNAEFNPKALDHLPLDLSKLYQKNFYRTPVFLYRLKRLEHVYRSIFQDFDVLISPVLAHTTPKLGYLSLKQDFGSLFERLQN